MKTTKPSVKRKAKAQKVKIRTRKVTGREVKPGRVLKPLAPNIEKVKKLGRSR